MLAFSSPAILTSLCCDLARGKLTFTGKVKKGLFSLLESSQITRPL